ncbi:MAG: penicillin-binding protein 2, partial [Nitrospinota bacterium]|nr:penicillin-binding protein 2 [Nitrospinota bacterium]
MLRTRPEWESFLQKRKEKIRVFGFALGIGCLVITFRLWHLQVIEHSTLAGRAESNRIRQITMDARRGIIIDRNGAPLVATRPAFQLSIIPEDSADPASSLAYISERIK